MGTGKSNGGGNPAMVWHWRGLPYKRNGAAHHFRSLKRDFGISYGAQPQKVHSKSFGGTIEGI